MSDKTRILIGYDGSECADAALEDLISAGLPKTADVVVMSLADVFLPPSVNEEVDNPFPTSVPTEVRRAHELAERKLKEAESTAKRASEQIKKSFPQWRVSHEALADSPAWSIIRKAD